MIPTATQIRAHLEGYGITTSIVSDDWIEDERDNTVIPHVNSVCRTDVESEKTVTEYVSGNGTDILFISSTNATLQSISLVSGSIDAEINLSSVEMIKDEGIIKAVSNMNLAQSVNTFPRGAKNIKVTYTVGGSCPDDLAQSIKKLTAVSILDNIEGRTGGGDLRTQGWSRSYGNQGKYSNARKKLADQARMTLRRYSTAVVGS